MKVIKKDGTLEKYNEQKIINAINKSAQRENFTFSQDEYGMICNRVINEIDEEDFENNEVPVGFIHNIVEKTLLDLFPKIGYQYQQYRNYKLDFVHMMDTVYEESQKIMYIGDKENSNTDSALVSTKRSLVLNELNKQLYKKFFLTVEERQAVNDGYIYIHDMSARRDTMNCCLFDVAEVMSGGFEMGNVWYNEPKTLDTAFDVIGDITLSAASQEYGGFTLPQIDEVLVPYAKKSYEKYKHEFYDIADNLLDYRHSYFEQKAHDYVIWNKVIRDLNTSSIQSLPAEGIIHLSPLHLGWEQIHLPRWLQKLFSEFIEKDKEKMVIKSLCCFQNLYSFIQKTYTEKEK